MVSRSATSAPCVCVVQPFSGPTPGHLLRHLLTSAPSRPALPPVALRASMVVAAVSSTRGGQLAAALGPLVSRFGPVRVLHPRHAPLAAQISPGKERELSVHKRRIYRRLRTGGLCCHVPARLASLGLDYAVSVRHLAPLALQLPPDKTSRSCPCLRLVVILALMMSPSRYSHRGLSPHKFAPMLGAHPSLKRSANGRPPGPVWRYAVRGTFSPAWAWRPAVVARLARTLGCESIAVLT